eukprot:12634-Chlamydomonas_euryale.AAC.1
MAKGGTLVWRHEVIPHSSFSVALPLRLISTVGSAAGCGSMPRARSARLALPARPSCAEQCTSGATPGRRRGKGKSAHDQHRQLIPAVKNN